MNAFTVYAGKAKTIVEQPKPLVGKHKTRAEAKAAYAEIVVELRQFSSRVELEAYLGSISADILQFHAELDFLWEGDGEDFLGLEREIERAFETVEAAQFFKLHQLRPTTSSGARSGNQAVSL